MDYKFLQPNTALSNYINGYHYINDKDYLQGKMITLLPSGNIIIAIYLGGNGFEIVYNNTYQSKIDYSVISGIKEGACNIIVEGLIKCLLIDFNPIGFYNLFNIPGKNILNKVNNVVDILGSDIKDIIQKLYNQNCIYNQKNILDKYFIQKLNCSNENNPLSPSLINLFYSTTQIQILTDICCSCDLSLRYIEKKFMKQVGITPVKFKRIIRANLAFKFMMLGESNFEIIYKLNFYDQSHFIKEFKWLTGFTPEILKSEIVMPFNIGMLHFIISKESYSLINN